MISKNLFELTPDEIETSKQLYGKVIKCLIAPYHNIQTIPLEPNDEVYVYPERDLSIQQRKELISTMSNSRKEEILFVTSDIFIILDMVGTCTRILTPDGKIEETTEKTFAANPHTIIYNVLQDDRHIEKHKQIKGTYTEKINSIITKVNSGKMTNDEYKNSKEFINTIGEDIIRTKLLQMLRNVEIV